MTTDAGELMALVERLKCWRGAQGIGTSLLKDIQDAEDALRRIADREAVAREVAEIKKALYGLRDHDPFIDIFEGVSGPNIIAKLDAILSLLAVQVDGEQKETHATKPSPSSTSATATETALRAAKRLCDNINEFGHVTDAEIFDATETAIQKALETINVA